MTLNANVAATRIDGKHLRRIFPLFAVAGVSLATVPACAQATEFSATGHAYRVVTVAGGLDHPWGVAFLPGGDMLVTERPGRLRLVRKDGTVEPTPIAGVPEVFARGQGGLLDVALHPAYEQNQVVYLSYSKPGANGATTAVIRGRFDDTRLNNVEEIFEAKAWSPGGNHFGSRLVFDRDGYLFITVGDRGARPELGAGTSHPAQDLSSHQGTIIRLHDDGRVPGDNPFVGRAGALPEIWSYGHRSLQGLALRPETGELWETEHGPQGGDELNKIEPALNYGWPVIGHGVQYGGSQIHETTAREGMQQPVHYWVPSIATSGLAFYNGDIFPEWTGNAFVGGLAGQHLVRLVLRGDEVVATEKLLDGFGERIRDVRTGPDGFLYVLTDEDNGKLLRLEPTS
ncbi:MAG TPA: PQQ-dependent sugar dehydrogenase [Longimicrobiaceae bacterium]|nr:PQQ-dependent sugar dehydrogenase [Longimicrobiaceae bacterium]